MGDLFDFWYEYRKVVPKGYVRILGKMAELTDAGIPLYFFVGNHDMWMKDYFQQELNIPVYFEPVLFPLTERNSLVGHGDGLGPGDHGYKFIKRYSATKPVTGSSASCLPIGMGIANYFSRKSWAQTGQSNEVFSGRQRVADHIP